MVARAGHRAFVRAVVILALLSATLIGTLPIAPAGAASTGFVAQVLSSRPEMVSGGEALIRIDVPTSLALGSVTVRLNGVAVTSGFHPVAGHALLGRPDGIRPGQNVVTVSTSATASGVPPTELTLVDYPITGPIFSGQHETPFICQTVQSGLWSPLDADCSTFTRYDFFYKSWIDQQFHPLVVSALPPWDTAWTTTLDGHTVPYIVRVERGTIDRAIYRIAALYNPYQTWEPWAPQAGWNGRLLYTFDISCGPGYHQGTMNAQDAFDTMWLNDLPLAQGFAVATSSLNSFGTNCNSILSAEAMMMAKAHFIARYGLPRWTMGWGVSGGAVQQYLIADNYPGLLDGIVPDLGLLDALSPTSDDCRLLGNYFNGATGWTDAQKAAASGLATFNSCALSNAISPYELNPSKGCDPVVPQALIYDPVTNPRGARCTIVDHNVNALGRDPVTGFARDPFDNVGVQYGLGALNAGTITVDQFLDLNAKIGGFDPNGNPTAARSSGDPVALTNTYRDGLVLSGGLGLRSTPIIDFRIWAESLGDFHPTFWSFAARQRLIAANGEAGNQVIWETATDFGLWSRAGTDAFAAMTQWLDNITADMSDLSLQDRVLRDKPTGLGDRCYLNPANPSQVTPGTCTQALPINGDPRIAAGAPLVDNVGKCALKPIDLSAYRVEFTPAQQTRLQAIFPSGVCDFSQPGVGQVAPSGPWESLGPAPH